MKDLNVEEVCDLFLAAQLAEEVACVDPAHEVEPAHLIPGTQLRPADILTGALGCGLVALYVFS